MGIFAKGRVEKVLAWGTGWAVLEVEFWHVFEHVIEYLCEKDVFKKCWHGLAGLAGWLNWLLPF